MSEWLDVPIRPGDAWRALWAHFRGRPYLMRVQLIANREWYVNEYSQDKDSK